MQTFIIETYCCIDGSDSIYYMCLSKMLCQQCCLCPHLLSLLCIVTAVFLSRLHCGIVITALLFVIIVDVTHECYSMMLDHTNKHSAKNTLTHQPTHRMCQSFWIIFPNKHRSVPELWNSINEFRISGGGETHLLQTIEIPLKYATAPIS